MGAHYASSFPGIFEPAAGFFRIRDGGVSCVRVEQGLTDLLIAGLSSDSGRRRNPLRLHVARDFSA
ncbi:MAG: hypothetical protein ABJC61_09120 [Acidobacteriota bacterium]